jgi:hypothetical protein
MTNKASVLFYIARFLPTELTSSAQTKNQFVPFLSWLSFTFLVAYAKKRHVTFLATQYGTATQA